VSDSSLPSSQGLALRKDGGVAVRWPMGLPGVIREEDPN